MIILRLRGGLGNQLFQYAAGKSLALHHHVNLKFDTYTYTLHPYRKFQLDKFCIDEQIAEQNEINALIGTNKILRYINKRYYTILNKNKVFLQPHYHFYNNFFDLPAHLYLSGYWQSEKYFLPIEKTIRENFRPRSPLSGKNKEIASAMGAENSISIHIRRGDYAANARYANFFGVLEDSYYAQAIEKMHTLVSNPIFYIFSDDIGWCKSRFASNANFTFVEHNTGDDSYYDMLLMSCCKHNIIANSTFSWWGAWLNENPEKTVIAPKNWFKKEYFTAKNPVYKDRRYNTSDLIPESWITL
jgi:hypothetical protein